ncbi:hypothetical protein GGF42_004134 [Coemansia sp. RSA 2424]|nr:hypothetical protein GGF42_004134 [Coemansia sp. RSA 2424]
MEFAQTLNELHVSLARCVAEKVPWSWVAAQASHILGDHSSGVARAVVLAELEAAWHRQSSSEEQDAMVQRTLGGFFQRGNTAPAPSALFALRIVGLEQLANTRVWVWRLSGQEPSSSSSSRQMAAFVHQQFYAMVESAEFEGFFAPGRAVFLAGLREAKEEGARLLLPTTDAVFVLRADRDARLLRAFFGVVVDASRCAAQTAAPEFDAGQVWGVVDAVRLPCSDRPHCAVVEITANTTKSVAVEFHGSASSLARAFHRGDCLGLVCASSSAGAGAAAVAYGAQTLAFVLAAAQQRTHDAAPGSHVTSLLARVVAVSPNMPDQAIRQQQRRALRVVADCAAAPPSALLRDVTAWGALAERAGRLRAGQTVLLRDFEEHAEADGAVVLNGSRDVWSDIYDVSALPAVPASTTLRRLQLLRHAFQQQAPFFPPASIYARAAVVRVDPLRCALRDARDLAGATKLVHALCGRRVQMRADGGGFECAMCARAVGDTASAFALAVALDDGTAVVHARVAPLVAATMLATSPDHFLRLPTRAAQLAALAKPLGQAFVACITSFAAADDSTLLMMRIDAACPADDVGSILIDEAIS